MVAATQSQPLPSPKQPPTPKPSPEEEALKRNTDCVYFLASPLTCKKGSECEYRHSEYARVNPRDCYYWLSGNCLNPKCGFRHPPLDGLIGTHVGAPASMPAANTVVAVPPILYNSGGAPSKQAVPCIFFQKGLCMKGDRCAFSHGLNPTFNKAPQPTVSTSSFEPHTLKKDFGGLVKCIQPSKVATGVAPEAKTVLMSNGVSTSKNLPMSAGFDDDVPRHKMSIGLSAVNGSRPSRLHHLTDEQSFPTSKDTDEHLRESSPGFDVLVDDEHGDSDYYHGEDQYGRARGHEGRNRNEYDTGFGNIEAMADADREIYHDSLGYDSFDRQRQYGWEQHRVTAEKGRGTSHQERRSYSKSEGPGVTEEADLRYRLSQHRRVNGLRSVVSHDHGRENRGDEHNHLGASRKDSHNLPQHGSTVSSRFRGRIKVPTSSAVDAPREMDRARNWSSSGMPEFSSHQGRLRDRSLRDRIKGRVDEDYSNKDGRSFRGPRMMDERHSDFAGPKRLAELKTGKNVDNKESQSLRKRKIMEENQQNEGDLSFKGPLPLSEILKRKRQAAASGNELSAGENNEKNNNNEKLDSISSMPKEKTASKEEQMITANNSTGSVEGKSEVAQGEPAELPNASEHENGNNMMEEGIEEHELEGDDQGDGEYYYEEGEEGDYTYQEGENVEGDYNYEGGENVEGDYAYEEGEHVEGEEHLECER